jgi:hypothetical protein
VERNDEETPKFPIQTIFHYLQNPLSFSFQSCCCLRVMFYSFDALLSSEPPISVAPLPTYSHKIDMKWQIQMSDACKNDLRSIVHGFYGATVERLALSEDRTLKAT